MYEIITIPCLTDNYSYLIVNKGNNDAIVVDVPEYAPIYDCINKNNLKLKNILLTHHHSDHITGVGDLVEKTGAKVHGNFNDKNRLPSLDFKLSAGEKYNIDNLQFDVFNSDGHTIGCISFYFAEINSVFTGDLLFTMGAGRMFEGTPELFFKSLQTIKSLPSETLVYSGHEYTAGNIKFAEKVVDLNDEYMLELKSKIDQSMPTVPSVLSNEINNNPFLLADSPEQFAEYRSLKDNS